MNRYAVLVKGTLRFILPGSIKSDGTIRLQTGNKTMPLVLKASCDRLGLDPAKVGRDESPTEAIAKLGENEGDVRVILEHEYRAEVAAIFQAQTMRRNAALEAAVPGIVEMLALAGKAYNEAQRYREAFNRMMDDESNDGARPPRPEDRSFAERLAALRASNPRADLYLRAWAHIEGNSDWADNTGSQAAAKHAMSILEAGGSIEDATAALAHRRDFVD